MNHYMNSSTGRFPAQLVFVHYVVADLPQGIQEVNVPDGGGYDKAVEAMLEPRQQLAKNWSRQVQK